LLAALLGGDLPAFDRLQRERGALALDSWCWPAPLFHAAAVGGASAAAVEAVAALLAAPSSGIDMATMQCQDLATAISFTVDAACLTTSQQRQLQTILEANFATAAHFAAAHGKPESLPGFAGHRQGTFNA
jgi:hypothetical protein